MEGCKKNHEHQRDYQVGLLYQNVIPYIGMCYVSHEGFWFKHLQFHSVCCKILTWTLINHLIGMVFQITHSCALMCYITQPLLPLWRQFPPGFLAGPRLQPHGPFLPAHRSGHVLDPPLCWPGFSRHLSGSLPNFLQVSFCQGRSSLTAQFLPCSTFLHSIYHHLTRFVYWFTVFVQHTHMSGSSRTGTDLVCFLHCSIPST